MPLINGLKSRTRIPSWPNPLNKRRSSPQITQQTKKILLKKRKIPTGRKAIQTNPLTAETNQAKKRKIT